ncbi:MAG TPA: hypothetical protein VEO55_08515, partial [Candidatus Dormibacteraeota bacterium]|nr:hypothetical protein [Candidatus Dormibacteraeota bacterium]
MPGQPPPVFEQVVGHFSFGVAVAVGVGPPVGVAVGPGVGVGPPVVGAGGMTTGVGVPSGSGVGATNGVADWTGFGSCSFCTVYVSAGAQNEKALEEPE